jgi:AraC-like DNA-binding protein
MARHSFTVSVAVLAQMVRYLEHLQLDVPEVFRSAGADPALLKYPDEQMPLQTYIDIENTAAELSGDPYFGLHMGEVAEPGNYSILGYIMMNSATLGEALGKAAQYYRIIGNLLRPTYRIRLKTVKIILSGPRLAPRFSRHCYEAAFSTQVTMMRRITGQRITPIGIGFVTPQPTSVDEYERVFGCPVRFGEDNNYVVLDNSLGRVPILQPNPELLAFFETYARDLLSRMQDAKPISHATTRAILERMSTGRVTIRYVAQEMAMGVRTLQTRLAGEGVSFSALLEDTRKHLAKEYLRDSYTVEEISMLLGFSDPSVFRKVFKKWMGTTPGQYRTSILAG